MFDSIANRAGSLQRLEAFLPLAGPPYAYRRNFDHGPDASPETSRLSPSLQRRIISEEEVLRRVLGTHSAEASAKFTQEVVWRTYWKGWLEWHPSVWESYRRETAELAGSFDSETYRRALEGATGIEAFDRWRHELSDTGFLHNHTRMWFASIWIFTLGLPWQLGASLFLHELLDADAASNTLSWRWVAGLHTKGKHYVARAENIEKYTGGRFRPAGQLNETPVPLSQDSGPLRLEKLPDFATDSLPSGKVGLLVHPEDFSVEQTTLGAFSFSSIALMPRLSGNRTAVVERFENLAQLDVRSRLQQRFGLTPLTVSDQSAFRKWARGLDAVVVVEPWTGPLRDELASWFEGCQHLLWLGRRTYDLELIPKATRGYFQFRKFLPQWLGSLATTPSPAGVRFRRGHG